MIENDALEDNLDDLLETCKIKKVALEKIIIELSKVNVKSKINKL
jgi:hypothetical protein